MADKSRAYSYPPRYGQAAMTTLWRYNTATGYWDRARTCALTAAEQWLAVYQKDEPRAAFKLARNKPTDPPE